MTSRVFVGDLDTYVPERFLHAWRGLPDHVVFPVGTEVHDGVHRLGADALDDRPRCGDAHVGDVLGVAHTVLAGEPELLDQHLLGDA